MAWHATYTTPTHPGIAMTSTENNSSLPGYAPSTPSPSYTCEPTGDEQTIQMTPVRNSPTTGTYIKESGKVVVTLFDQENATIPIYGSRGLIRGTIHFGNDERVSQVMLKVRWGKLVSDLTQS
jgi:hypothetical protein